MKKPVLNFKSTVLHQRIDALRMRVLAGDMLDASATLQQLQEMRAQAQALNDTDLELFAVNVSGVLYFNLGSLDDAQRLYEEGSALALRWENVPRWLNFQLNLGTVHTGRGDMQAACAVWESLLPAFKSQPQQEATYGRLYLVYANLAGAYVQLKDYAAAERYANHMLEDWDSPQVALIRAERRTEYLARSREVLASVYFARHQYDLARDQARLLLASQSNPLLPLATAARLMFVRLAVFDPADDQDAPTRWREFCDSIAAGIEARDRVLWSLGKIDLLVEAAFYREQGKLDWSRRCAQKAIDVLTALEDDEFRQKAQALLAELTTG